MGRIFRTARNRCGLKETTCESDCNCPCGDIHRRSYICGRHGRGRPQTRGPVIDMAYSCTQKGLSCPPGLGPLTVGSRAREVLHQRKTKVSNWYLDLSLIEHYWGDERTYHHTAPISMNFALREALRLVQEEGLENRFKRHLENAQFLWEGLEDIGLKMIVPQQYRLPTLTAVKVPDGIDEAEVRRRLLDEYNIEITGGLGAFKGKVWRIGLMGYSSRRENVVLLISALSRLLNK